MQVKINRESRYARGTTLLSDEEGNAYWANRKILEAPKRSDDSFHTVMDGERIDKIAADELGYPHRFWIICDYALRDGINLAFPMRSLVAGMVLRIPSIAYVEGVILQRGNG